MNNKNYLKSVHTISNGMKINGFNSRHLAEGQIKKDSREKDQNEQKEILRRLRIQNKKLLERVVTLKKKLKQSSVEKTKIIDELNHTKKLNHALSEALGSCDHCWGEDSDCPGCSGNGIPGWREINSRLFNIHILPALENMYRLSKKKK